MAAAEHDHVADDHEASTAEVRHRRRLERRLGWALRFRAIADRLERESERPPRPSNDPFDPPEPDRISIH
jgi:hypothetical protein